MRKSALVELAGSQSLHSAGLAAVAVEQAAVPLPTLAERAAAWVQCSGILPERAADLGHQLW